MLANRLRKRYRHLKKWAKQEHVTAFRLYENDIVEFPLIVDWYDGDVVCWIYPRRSDHTDEDSKQYVKTVLSEIQSGLNVSIESIYLKHRFRRSKQQNYEKISQRAKTKRVDEYGLSFEVNLSDYLDTGLFLDHRLTRKMVQGQSNSCRVLNLFAYTGSFSCYAITGGAESSVTVDLNSTYCKWARRNFELNNIPRSSKHRIIAQDCFEYLEDAVETGDCFDLVICDPPTFSNSKKMDLSSFSVDRDYPHLFSRIAKLLRSGGQLVFSTNSRKFKLDERLFSDCFQVECITEKTLPDDFRNKNIHFCWLLTRT